MAAPAIAHVIQVAAPVVMAVADSTLGISSMINDVKTVFDPHVSWTAKLMSVADLAINVAMDVDMVTGTGEGIRAAYVGIKSTVKLAGKEAEHAVIAESEHLAEKEVENTTKHEVEGAVEHSCNSFAADTPVATPTGAQPIGTLSVGDTVLAVDGANGKVIAEPVQHVFINHDDNLLDVTLTTSDPHTSPSTTKQQQADVAAHGSQAPPTDEILHTTTEHPFLTVELGWVNAQDLKPGEHVRRLDGTVGVVVGTQVVAGVAVRYNLTVANEHTYAVGTGQWVVHNCGFGSDASNIDRDHIITKHGDAKYKEMQKMFDITEGRVKSGKTYFKGFSDDEAMSLVDEAWKGRKAVSPIKDAATIEWEGQVGDLIIKGSYNVASDIVTSAFPLGERFKVS